MVSAWVATIFNGFHWGRYVFIVSAGAATFLIVSTEDSAIFNFFRWGCYVF